METIEDIVEAIKFFPSRPGKLVVRLLRHPDPVISIYTESDPLTYGNVELTFEGIKADTHEELMRMLIQVPLGKALCVKACPREDLQRWVTKADFTVCDLNEDVPPVAGAVGAGVELMGPNGGSHWNLPATTSSMRLGRKSGPLPSPTKPPDPESIFDSNPPNK